MFNTQVVVISIQIKVQHNISHNANRDIKFERFKI